MLKIKQNHIPNYDFKKAIKKPIPIRCYQMHEPFEVETLEGTMKGKKGDWLVIGIQGEMYLCDQSVFDMTYDLIL